MTKILNWRTSDDPRDIVHLAVQAIAEGHIVALPSSTSYLLVASGLKPSSVAQLQESIPTAPPFGMALMVRSSEETLDYFPDISPAARRLANKAWPGPIMLSLENSHRSSVLRCLSPEVCNSIHTAADRIHVWQPNHPILNQISRLTSGPLISSLAVAKQGPIADQVSNLGLAPFVLAVDDGEVHHPGEPTIVSMDGNQGRIVHHGVVSEQELKFISKWTVLFVCTGNTCRSPMAQALMQRKIAERYPGTATSDDISIVALSAGVSAFGGDPASHGAATAIRNFGTTLDQHQSTQLNSDLVEQADVILAMGNRHRQVIVSQWPNVAHKVHLISPDGGEISDPFGGPLDVYLKCAQQLDDYTTYWMDRLDVESLIQWKPAS